jgi:hypothetical protein
VGANQAREHVDYMTRPDTASDLNGQTLARPLINDSQALQLLPVGAAIEDEVIRPDVIGGRRR